MEKPEKLEDLLILFIKKVPLNNWYQEDNVVGKAKNVLDATDSEHSTEIPYHYSTIIPLWSSFPDRRKHVLRIHKQHVYHDIDPDNHSNPQQPVSYYYEMFYQVSGKTMFHEINKEICTIYELVDENWWKNIKEQREDAVSHLKIRLKSFFKEQEEKF